MGVWGGVLCVVVSVQDEGSGGVRAHGEGSVDVGVWGGVVRLRDEGS